MENNNKSFIDKYSQKKEVNNETKETPFDNAITRKDDFKLVKIDSQIHGDLKLAALKNNTTMKNIVDSAIREYLNELN
ncbi:hypothetical protein [Staphylococcus simulans]|uniref:hypothetical protein n=1 Tax=Staphylococcus simulans TaxID=1286 RepID=UPI001F3F4272|nr:hypothetical protein [Staphylococcus simulans]MCE5025542.1 hypothetical protein [Staphylococcus simulans]